MAGVHDVFHVSMLRKYLSDPSHVLQYPEVEITPDLRHKVEPIRVLERSEKRLRNKTIQLVKVQWKGHTEQEATWEREKEIRENYPALF